MKSPPASSPGRPVWLPDWADRLVRANLPALTRAQYRVAILRYLRFCKDTRQRATVASARQFMQEREDQRQVSGADLAVWKGGLNWFFREGGRPGGRLDSAPQPPSPVEAEKAVEGGGLVLTGLPSLGAKDLGRAEWEQRLIRELRVRHYSWRTERTYREWSRL